MSFHVYLEPELQHKLDALCSKTGRKRNALVREALREYLDKRIRGSWPAAVFNFKPDPELVRFESMRNDLPPDRENVFETERL